MDRDPDNGIPLLRAGYYHRRDKRALVHRCVTSCAPREMLASLPDKIARRSTTDGHRRARGTRAENAPISRPRLGSRVRERKRGRKKKTGILETEEKKLIVPSCFPSLRAIIRPLIASVFRFPIRRILGYLCNRG